ncbi:hypothetical protein AADZ91_13050 [Colwelliaceae bacterium 6441]
MKEFPFDPYDFFGYISSGLVIVVGLEIIVGVPKLLGSDLKAFDILIASLGVYIAGQLIANPSKWLLEDLIVKRALKAPATNLMAQYDGVLNYVFPGYYVSLPADVVSNITSKVGTEKTGESLFLHIRFDPNVRNDEKLMSKLNVFLKNYGFARNLSLTWLLFGFSLLCFKDIDFGSEHTKHALISVASGIMLF